MESLDGSPARRWPPFVGDVLIVLFLAVAAFKLTYHASKVADLGMCDEVTYMWTGSLIPQAGMPEPAGCPLYCLWYYLLSFVQPDRVHLYMLNWSLLVFLVPVAVYGLVRSAGGSRPAGLIAGSLLLFWRVLDVYPYPSHFAAVALMLGTVLAVWIRRTEWSLAILGSTLLVASFVRPEYFTSFLLFSVAAFGAATWAVLRDRGRALRLIGPALVVLIFTALLLWRIGNPLAGGRSFMAFGQHYAVNVAREEKIAVNACVHWQSIARRDFGDAHSVAHAWRANSRAVLWHIGINARELPKSIGLMASPRFVALSTAMEMSFKNPFLLACLLLAVLGAGGLVCRLWASANKPEDNRRLVLILTMLTLVLVPTTVSALVVYPRAHYLMPSMLLCLGLAAANWQHLPAPGFLRSALESRPAFLALGGAILALIPNLAHGWDLHTAVIGKPPSSAPVLTDRAIVTSLKRLKIHSPVVALDATAYSHTFYAGLSTTFVWPSEKTDNFWSFVQRRNINLIILDPTLAVDVLFRDDPEFQAFKAGKQTKSFTLFEVPNTPVLIAARKDLLLPLAEDKVAGN
jgi:hypothetical protein